MSRPERVAELIKKAVSQIIIEKVSDPRIGFISVTDVKITPDLKTAKIFITVFGDEKVKKDTLAGLKSATPFIRGELGNEIDFKFVPEIYFVYDKDVEKASRLLTIMNKLDMEKEKNKPDV